MGEISRYAAKYFDDDFYKIFNTEGDLKMFQYEQKKYIKQKFKSNLTKNNFHIQTLLMP